MMRRRRRRAEAIWANEFTLNSDNGQVIQVFGALNWWYTTGQLLPAGRVNWLAEQRKKPTITVAGILLWLDFWWENVRGASNLADTDLYIAKFSEDAAGEGSQFFDPFAQPQVPGSVANWGDTDVTTDGLDPFLWRHHIKGQSPPNSVVGTYDFESVTNAREVQNQGVRAHAADSDNPRFICRKFHVTQEWQPDVHVKTKRRLRNNEGLILGMLQRQNTQPSVATFLDVRVVAYGY